MLISVGNDHKEHLDILISQPVQVVLDFCKLASQFLQDGPNLKKYSIAAQKLEVEVEVIQNCIYGLIHLLMLACKHKLNKVDFRDSVLSLGFSEEQEVVLSQFYEAKQNELSNSIKTDLKELEYHDLQWRFEVQLASRSLLEQVTPLITMDLALKTHDNTRNKPEIQHHLLQTDPTNLVHITNELEAALSESKSRHSRKVQRILSNLH